jgi:hypothetical protein
MKNLFSTIQELVDSGNYVIGAHAAERLDERGIMDWQVVGGLSAGVLLRERPNAQPNPAVEVEILLEDGTPIKSVWSLLRQSGVAKLVTVHFFDEG